MGDKILRDYKIMSPEDRRTFHRWIKANAILGLVFAVGIVAMAVAGSNSEASRGSAVADASAQAR
jgi:hypothetical protein